MAFRPLLIVCALLCSLCFATRPVLAGAVGYYPNGQIQWEYLYQNGQVREAKWYDELGRLSARTTFQDGKPGLSEGYRSDGSLEWQSRQLADGRQEVTRFAAGRRPEMRYQVVDGQTDGPSILFHPNGEPRQFITFRNGMPHGPARTYDEQGRLESEYAYRDGVLDGPLRTYSPDGRTAAEFLFENGEMR